MSNRNEPFGAQLYAELRKISGYDIITGLLDYATIQRLKQADRDTTVKLFSGSSWAVRQDIKTKEPPDVARFLVEEARRASNDGTAQLGAFMIVPSE